MPEYQPEQLGRCRRRWVAAAFVVGLSAPWLVVCGDGVHLAGDADGFLADAAETGDEEGRADVTADTADAEAPDSEVADEGGCGAIPATPKPLAPLNGSYSGSMRGPEWTDALRPLFRWRRPSDDPCREATTEIQLDDSCPPTGFEVCDLPTPEAVATGLPGAEWRPSAALPVGAEAPVGRRYFWRLRSCNAVGCSPWSSVRYLDVGRIADDPNGDGYADLAVGDPNNMVAPECSSSGISPNGSVDIYYGGPDGLEAEVRSVLCDPIGSSASLQFGLQLAWAGDVDADGFGDLLVTAFRGDMDRTTDNFHVFLYYGSAAGIDGAPDVRLDNPTGSMTADFGWAIAGAGDTEGDGRADVVVGARAQPPPDAPADVAGSVFLFRSDEVGFERDAAVRIDCPERAPGSGGCAFGFALLGRVDLNRDGQIDLVVGAPSLEHDSAGRRSGSVFGYGGDGSELAAVPSFRLDNPDPARDEFDHGGFGASLAALEYAAGSTADLVAAAAFQDHAGLDDGVVFGFRWGTDGPGDVPVSSLAHPDARAGAFFGAGLAAGDIDRDGHDELLVGAPDYVCFWGCTTSPGPGAVFAFRGGPAGLAGSSDLRLGNPDGTPDAGFGWSICVVADADGDGYPEVAIGAPFTEDGGSYAGRVFVYSGGPSGLSADPVLRLEGRPASASSWFRFGYAVR
jgi:hypothetical protein